MREKASARSALHAVRRDVLRRGLIPPGTRALVAFSGGPDSTALLHILLELRRELAFDLALAHFNHRLRPSADEDERFARATARSLGLPIVVGRRDVRAYARSRRLNIEEAARVLRYAFLERAADRLAAARIATGHTLNDQAETFLLRLIRGSGPRGLAGIRPEIGGRLIRPLLGVSRAEVLAFCRVRGLAYRVDETNRDRRFVRNRIRHGLIPYLERHFEPRIVAALGRAALILQDEEAALDDVTRRAHVRLATCGDSPARLDALGLARLSPGLGRRVVRAHLEELRGDLRRLSFEDIEAVRLLKEGGTRVLPGGMRLRREGGRIGPVSLPPRPRPFRHSWDGRARLAIGGSGMSFRGRRLGRAGAALRFDDQKRAFLDADALAFPLLVRSREPGDLYRPLGAPGRKKLKEILRAKGIPAASRDGLPVFYSGGEIVWVPGLPAAERFKVTPSTKRIFVIERTGYK